MKNILLSTWVKFNIAILFLCFGAKLNAQQAALQWMQSGGGGGFIGSNSSHPDPDEVFSSAIDKDDNLIVGGACTWTPRFDSIYFGYINGSQYNQDNGFIAKYNSCGDIQWVSVLWGRQTEWVTGLDVDDAGNIYAIGVAHVGATMADSAVFITPHGNVAFRNCDIFFVKFSPDGHLLHLKTIQNIWTPGAEEYFFPAKGNFKRFRNNTFLTVVEAMGRNSTVHIDNFVTVPGSHNFLVFDSMGSVSKGAIIDTSIEDSEFNIYVSNFVVDSNENIYLDIINYDLDSLKILDSSFNPAPKFTSYLIKTDTSFTIKQVKFAYLNGVLGRLFIHNNEIYACERAEDGAVFDWDTVHLPQYFAEYRVYKINTNLDLQWVSKPDVQSLSSTFTYLNGAASKDNIYLGFQTRGNVIWDSFSVSTPLNVFDMAMLRLRASDGVCVEGKLLQGHIASNDKFDIIKPEKQGGAYFIGSFGFNIGIPTDTVYNVGNLASPDYFIVKWGLPCTDTISTLDAPEVPVNLVATATGTQTIDISWNDVAQGETGFNLYRSPDGINNWTMVATTAANTPLYTNNNLIPNTTYWYKVTSFNQTSESAYSNIDSATTWPAVCSTGIAYTTTDSLYTFNTTNTGTGPFAYNWSINGNASVLQNLNAILDTAGTYYICVTVTDAFNCTSTACDTITIVAPVCGTAVSATQTGTYSYSFATVNTGTAPYAYSWTVNGSNPSTSNPFTYTFAGTTNSYNICVTVTDGNNCMAIACDTVDIQQAACATNLNYTNDGYDYTFSTTNTGTGPYTYLWSDGGNPISMSDTVNTNLSVGTHNICVTVTDANNCTATGCQTVTTPTCSTSIAYTNNGSVYTFSTTNTGVAPYTYIWFDGNSMFNMLDTAIYTPLPGIRTICVSVTDANGCIAMTCEEINVQTDTCFASLTATHSGNTYTFVVNNFGTAPFSYEWANNGTVLPSSAATATVQLAVGSNNVCVTIRDANGCTVTKCRQVTITGIAEELKAAFNIYPNPVADVMKLEIKAEQDGNIQLTITDLQGRIMSSETRQIVQGTNLLAYNTALWVPGIYQVHIQYGNKRYNSKLVKM